MANQLDRQILEEGPRNVIVKWTGVLTDSDISETPALALTDMVNNEASGKLLGFRVDLFEYSISNGIEVILEWNSLNPQIIMPLTGHGHMCATAYGGLLPNTALSGFDGAINLRSTNFQIGQTFTFSILAELVKMYKGAI